MLAFAAVMPHMALRAIAVLALEVMIEPVATDATGRRTALRRARRDAVGGCNRRLEMKLELVRHAQAAEVWVGIQRGEAPRT